MAFKIWTDHWFWGLGTAYQKVLGRALDMGIAIVLVSVGAVGLLALCVLLFKSWKVGRNTLNWGYQSNSHWAIVAGVALIGQVTLMIVYQQWLSPYVAPILGVSGGVCVSRGLRSSDIPYSNGDGDKALA
jgi:NADH:ubiquinone oxidoreductase subunit 6 (subunit J)